jgi:hypothetical protein
VVNSQLRRSEPVFSGQVKQSYGSSVDSLNAYDVGWVFGVIVTLWVIYLALR